MNRLTAVRARRQLTVSVLIHESPCLWAGLPGEYVALNNLEADRKTSPVSIYFVMIFSQRSMRSDFSCKPTGYEILTLHCKILISPHVTSHCAHSGRDSTISCIFTFHEDWSQFAHNKKKKNSLDWITQLNLLVSFVLFFLGFFWLWQRLSSVFFFHCHLEKTLNRFLTAGERWYHILMDVCATRITSPFIPYLRKLIYKIAKSLFPFLCSQRHCKVSKRPPSVTFH